MHIACENVRHIKKALPTGVEPGSKASHHRLPSTCFAAADADIIIDIVRMCCHLSRACRARGYRSGLELRHLRHVTDLRLHTQALSLADIWQQVRHLQGTHT
jgi:hypothetical protein